MVLGFVGLRRSGAFLVLLLLGTVAGPVIAGAAVKTVAFGFAAWLVLVVLLEVLNEGIDEDLELFRCACFASNY